MEPQLTKLPRQLLSVKEVSELTGIGVSTIWRNAKLGRFPTPIAICGMKRWRVADIEQLLCEQGSFADL
jgi:predicted DNA-binding transcriptional regulator AlpA